MKLHHDNRVLFDEVAHLYLLDGQKLLTGVTTLMSKYGLGADYGDIPEAVLKKAAEEGTAIHKELQLYEKGESIFASELVDEYRNLGLKFIEAEYPVTDYELIASAIDMVYMGSKPNSVILADIKTTSKLHTRALQYQLGIYKYLFERMNPGIEVEGCYCIWIEKKKKALRDYIKIEPVDAKVVETLLNAERNGLPFFDTPDSPGLELILGQDANNYLQNMGTVSQLKAQIKAIEEAMKAYDAKILAYMEENNLADLTVPDGKITRKASYTQTRVDSAKLQKDFPAVYAKCAKTTTVKGSISYKPNKE